MSITIGNNIVSLQAQRRLGIATDSLARTFEKLSSGMRINKASCRSCNRRLSAS